MPGAVRQGDACTGHGCWPPRANSSWSSNVFINSRGAHRVTDGWSSHCCGPACHASVQASGSPNVFVNGLALARIGDSIACGSSNASGSGNVIIN